MLRMIETHAESARIRRCARERLLVVTRAARGDFLSGRGFARRCVTRVTLAVGVQAGGNGKRDAAIQRSVMASRATALWSCRAHHVLRVIELNVEFLFEGSGKTFQRRFRAAYICVTDRAHRNRRCDKLGEMTTGACRVPGKGRLDRIIRGSLMTSRARLRGVALACVFES